MICNDCGIKIEYAIRSNATGNKYRCSECELKAEEELGIKREEDLGRANYRVDNGFKPYTLTTGWIYKLWEKAPDWPGMDKKTQRFINIRSRAHERDTMKAMGEASGFPVHFGEKGEKPGGHDLGGFEKQVRGRVYSYRKVGK